MIKLYILVDYKGFFGSKYDAIPYQSGMDKILLTNIFTKYGIDCIYLNFSEIINYDSNHWKNQHIIYTSSEDSKYLYKSYIEDIIYYLELAGANVMPTYKYLKANNNKVFMELLRHSFDNTLLKSTPAKIFGCIEELEQQLSSIKYPIVFKKAEGAMSKGVGLAVNKDDLIRKIKTVSRAKSIKRELWEFGRCIKYKRYTKQSKYRQKFILQDFINGLNGDYKILIFGNKYYVLKRETKKNDFRSSGSGINHFTNEIPDGILEYAHLCFQLMKVANASFDIGYDGNKFHLIEFQCLYFGSYTISYSNYFWEIDTNNTFTFKEGKSVLEEEYAKSIYQFISKQ